MMTRTFAGLAVLAALLGAPAARAGDASSDRALAAAKSTRVTTAPPAPAPQQKSSECSCHKA